MGISPRWEDVRASAIIVDRQKSGTERDMPVGTHIRNDESAIPLDVSSDAHAQSTGPLTTIRFSDEHQKSQLSGCLSTGFSWFCRFHLSGHKGEWMVHNKY